jgi:hypothetical protein
VRKLKCFARRVVLALAITACGWAGTGSMARADWFGGDLLILSEILVNALQQLVQLQQILSTGRENIELLEEINRGLNDVLGIAKSSGERIDPGLYGDLKSREQVAGYMQSEYGPTPDSSDAKVQDHSDRVVAEAISLNNDIYAYAKEVDSIGDEIKRSSAVASPKGAQRLTVESLGVMLHVMNQSLRTQATGLKIQAQTMAAQNRKDKQFSAQVRTTSTQLHAAMGQTNPAFKLPRL